ncbi:hypothetical protein EGW08_023234 [Elysia chlorotica]|uniref:Ketoreductase domain-containing protein n=1 Tax=Elysia chlorotica TaxID=188477 RepID=A0A3S0Z1Z8_ELYCH|nr:hypothetical protein EGW08_023234 [Elysia chlorotica]
MPQSVSANGTKETGVTGHKEHGTIPTNYLYMEAQTKGDTSAVETETGENITKNSENMDCPRASLLLEEFRFVPYVETCPPPASKALKQYASDCFNYAMIFVEEWIMEDQNGYVPNKEILIDVLARKRPRGVFGFGNLYSGPDCGLAKAMQKVFRLSLACNMSEKINSFLVECKDMFYSDQLLASLHTTDILKPCIDIVAENINTETMVALEVGGVQNAIYHRLMSISASMPSKPIVYKVAHTGLSAEFPETVSIVTQDQLKQESSLQDQSVDLLILNHVLHKQENLDTCLDTYSKLLKEGGFLLVKEVTGNFALCLAVEALSETEEFPRTRGDRIFGRYLQGSAWSKLFSLHGFDIIYERTDGVFATLYLLRKRVLQSSIANPMIFKMNELHYPWLENLSAKMRKMEASPKDAKLWLLAKKETSGILGFLKCLRGEPGGDKVRAIFISNLLASSTEPYISDDSPELKWILQRDLTQNVFRDGAWGSFRHIPWETGTSTEPPGGRASCDPDKSYIVVTGPETQGPGVELVHWLVERGARRILLCSSGCDPSQAAKLTESCQASGSQVQISRRNVTTVDGAWGLVNQAQALAPLGGVFNVHSVTRYGLFQRQTRETFQEVCDPKVQATINLDHVTRTLCSNSLEWFVVLSCACAGRGMKGHTNSGFSGSVVERICEKRQADKLPGLAIQLGNATDARHCPDQDNAANGHPGATLQDTTGLLVTLDALLTREACPVVSSMVKPETMKY